MQRTQIFAAASVAALLSLAACNQEPEVISANGVDPQADELAKAPPVELPPAIQASRPYRCDDNSLVYAPFYTNNTAKVSAAPGVTGTNLTAQAGPPPFVPARHSLT